MFLLKYDIILDFFYRIFLINYSQFLTLFLLKFIKCISVHHHLLKDCTYLLVCFKNLSTLCFNPINPYFLILAAKSPFLS